MKYDQFLGVIAAGAIMAFSGPTHLVAQVAFSLPADSIALVDLSAFAGEPDGWRIVGAATADRERDARIVVEPGQGILANVAASGRGADLRTAWEHGDIDLDLEFMMPRASNSGLYFQGRYELQLLDSWRVERPTHSDVGGIYQRWDESRGAGREGYEGHAPRVNAARAPGLWQTLRVEFRAPRFDAQGRKIANARFARVELNGAVLHENVELSGPTRGAASPGEAATGPLVIQGDHGPVAIRKIRFKRYQPQPVTFSDLRFRVYEGTFVRMPDLAGETPARFGEAGGLSASSAGVADGFALVHEGTIDLPSAGRYLLEMSLGWIDGNGGDGTQGGARLLIGGHEVLRHDGTTRVARSEADLPRGRHPFVLELFKNREGRPAVFTLYAEGPGVERQALHASATTQRGTPTGPITVEPGAEPYLLRGFVEHRGEKRTHVISVGDPLGIHYSYDAELGAPLLAWRGPFLETTQMWEGRGEPQLAEPLGSVLELAGGPSIAVLPDPSTAWPDSLAESDGHRILGYDLGEDRRPVFRYQRGPLTVEDRVRPADDLRGLVREIRVTSAAAGSAYLRLAAGEVIERRRDGSYVVDDAYYVVPDRSLRGVVIRDSAGGQELMAPVDLRRGGTTIEYEVVW